MPGYEIIIKGIKAREKFQFRNLLIKPVYSFDTPRFNRRRSNHDKSRWSFKFSHKKKHKARKRKKQKKWRITFFENLIFQLIIRRSEECSKFNGVGFYLEVSIKDIK